MIPKIPSPEATDRERVRRGGLHELLRLAWPVIEPETFVDGRHLQEISTHLEALSRGEIENLVINVPPGTSKSSISGWAWPVWHWIEVDPTHRLLSAAANYENATRDSLRCKELIRSDWFQRRWGALANPAELAAEGRIPVTIHPSKKDTEHLWYGGAGGLQMAIGAGTKLTGWHFHLHRVDDPHDYKPEEMTPDALDKRWDWWQQKLITRAVPGFNLRRLIVMQRLHDGDLAGRALATGDYTHLCLPMVSTGDPVRTAFGGDWRARRGQLLWPEMYNAAWVKAKARSLNTQANAQLQQDPSAEGGGLFKGKWVQRYAEAPSPSEGIMIQSWDLAQKDTAAADWTVGVLLLWRPPNYYVIDEIRAQLQFPEQEDAMRAARRDSLWGQAQIVVVEDKANGIAILQKLKREWSNLVAYNPGDKSKVLRASAVQPIAREGHLWYPATGEWVAPHLKELTRFPKARHDDRVDAIVQGILYCENELGGAQDLVAGADGIQHEIAGLQRGKRAASRR